MFKNNHPLSLVTAVLPGASSARVADVILQDEGTSILVSKARGTLLKEQQWKWWVPEISPSKTMLRMVVANHDIDRVVSTVINQGKLHLQATGAVFSTPCENVYVGSEFRTWPGGEVVSDAAPHDLSDTLSVIYCVAGHKISDKIAKAAINAGAHGPVVYYSEGRGLRDRLGWLRITKEMEKEVLMVIADDADVEEIFDAMAMAGDLHLPGRGFMYRLSINKGLFNLPSRISHHHYAANMQQIINAIDHLNGHTHWRDQSVFEIGGAGKGVGLDFIQGSNPSLFNQVCLSAIVNRDNSQALMDLLLDAGAPGLNVSYSRFATKVQENHDSVASVNAEYAFIRCITDEIAAEQICAVIENDAEDAGIRDLCALTHDVPRVATYVPGRRDHRADARGDIAAA